jgi:A/G-specific adenine glycosylase
LQDIAAMSLLTPKAFGKNLIAWYHNHKRDLPWRHTNDAYKVWLSEIILQQTRVNQGMPYYYRFIEKYPSIEKLAKAQEQDVLRLWQGLGYYSRARNLHACAKKVVADYAGTFPTSYKELKTLPGIGDYTAAAIASFSFKERVAVVDGNVYRVLARVFGLDIPINTPKAKKEFFELSNKLISTQQPDIYNQAVMEFGALHCTPQNPKCDVCVFAKVCFANRKGLQKWLPVKEKKLKVRKRYLYYFVYIKGKSIAMRKREAKDIWQGLYDFDVIEREKAIRPELLSKEVNIQQFEITRVYKHVLTHQVIFARFLLIHSKGERGDKFYSLKKVAELPKPVLISKFLEEHGFLK